MALISSNFCRLCILATSNCSRIISAVNYTYPLSHSLLYGLPDNYAVNELILPKFEQGLDILLRKGPKKSYKKRVMGLASTKSRRRHAAANR